MIYTITLDLWNTIFNNKSYSDFRLDFFIQFLEKKHIAISLEEIKKAFHLAFYLPERNYKKNNHIYTEQRITNLLKNLKIKLSEIDINLIKNRFEGAMLRDPPLLKMGVIKTIEELSSNYKLGLISNTGVTPGRIINKIFQRYEIFKYFKAMIYSDEIGYYKPHKILFETALEHLKCRPQNVIHIGDNLETDIKGAKDCNFYTIWFNESKLPKLENIEPDYEICKFTEIIQIIKEFK